MGVLRSTAEMQAHAVFDQFLLAGLDGEVALGKGNCFLARVAVLGDQVAGVAGEHEIFDGAFGAAADLDDFRDVTKMILRVVARRFA